MAFIYNEKNLKRIDKRRKRIIELSQKKKYSDYEESRLNCKFYISTGLMMTVTLLWVLFLFQYQDLKNIQFQFPYVFFTSILFLYYAYVIYKKYQINSYKAFVSNQLDFYNNFESISHHADDYNSFYLDYHELFKQYCAGKLNKNNIDFKILNVDCERLFNDFKNMKNEMAIKNKYSVSSNKNLELNYLNELIEQDKIFVRDVLNIVLKIEKIIFKIDEEIQQEANQYYFESNYFRECFKVYCKIMKILKRSKGILTEHKINEFQNSLSQMDYYNTNDLNELNQILNNLENEVRNQVNQ